jgi:oligosaccharide translocation protein RFT1
MDLKNSDSAFSSLSAGKKSSLLSRSAEGATFLIVLQIGSRALTFAVNQLLLQYLSPELLGISTQLEVYSISALFLARESLRVAIQRQTDTIEEDSNGAVDDGSKPQSKETDQFKKSLEPIKTQEIINLSYISISLGVLFATLLGWAYWRSLRSAPPILETPYFKVALELYAVATLLELLAEPCFVVVQQKSEYKIRAAAEGTATICRCLITCTFAVLAARRGIDIGVLPFAIGQLVYGFSLSFVYYRRVYVLAFVQGFSLRARPISTRYPTLATQCHIFYMLMTYEVVTVLMSSHISLDPS